MLKADCDEQNELDSFRVRSLAGRKLPTEVTFHPLLEQAWRILGAKGVTLLKEIVQRSQV